MVSWYYPEERRRCIITPTDTMFCANCGKKIEGEGFLCPECAAKGIVPNAEVLAAAESVAPAPAAPVVPGNEEAVIPPVADAPAAEYTQSAAPAAPETPVIPEAPAYTNPAAPVIPEAPAYTAPAAPVYQVPGAQAPSQPVPGFTLSSAADGVKKPGKKKKGLFIGLGIAAIVLIAGIVLLALNWNNWFGGKRHSVKVPDDPAEYIAFLHEPQMEGMARNIAKIYGRQMGGNQLKVADAELKLYLGDDLLNMLRTALAEQGMDMDMAWLQEISLKVHADASNEKLAAANMDLLLGRQKIVGLDYVLDLENFIMYMGLPEVNPQYMKLDMGEMGGLSLQNAQVKAQMRRDMPSEEEIQELVESYGEIILRYMTDVEREQVTVQAGEAQQKVTALTVTLTSKQMAEMFREILEYTKENETVRQIAQAYVNYTNAQIEAGMYDMPAVSMEEFDEAMDEAIAEMQENARNAEKGDYLHLITYADGADILGQSIRVFIDNQQEMEAGYTALTKENTTYLEAKVDADGSIVTVTGEGKRAKGLLSGEYVVERDGEKLLTLELTDVDTETGYGVYDIDPSAALLQQMDDDMGVMSMMAAACSFRLELGEGKASVALMSGNTKMLGMEVLYADGKPGKVAIPENFVEVNPYDESQLMQWAAGCKLDTVLENLKEAGLPNQLYTMLKMMLQQN